MLIPLPPPGEGAAEVKTARVAIAKRAALLNMVAFG